MIRIPPDLVYDTVLSPGVVAPQRITETADSAITVVTNPKPPETSRNCSVSRAASHLNN